MHLAEKLLRDMSLCLQMQGAVPQLVGVNLLVVPPNMREMASGGEMTVRNMVPPPQRRGRGCAPPVLSRCGHAFHAECLSGWLLHKHRHATMDMQPPRCPVCASPRAVEEESDHDDDPEVARDLAWLGLFRGLAPPKWQLKTDQAQVA